MTWTVTVVPTSELRTIWTTVAPLLSPAVKRSGGRVTMATLFSALSERRSVLWVAYPEDRTIRAAFVTRVAQYPAKKTLVVDFTGGSDMPLWVNDAQATFRAYATDAGCAAVELAGRAGWERMLRPYGWTPSYVVLEVSVASNGAES